MPKKTQPISKKNLKDHINKNGGFIPMSMSIEENFPKAVEKKIREKYSEKEANEMIENGTYVKGLSSNGDLNRNGYIIRSKAWKPAIEGYLNNPIVLLQHNTEKVIGVTISAKVTKNGLESEAVLFKDQMDEQSALAFDRGQLKALSTGHITLEIEWENTDTGEIKSTEEFRELPWEERWSDFWVMAVNALEWVEQSLVSIPSNRDSMITTKNQKLGWFKNKFGEDVSQYEKENLDEDPNKEPVVETENLDTGEEEPIEKEKVETPVIKDGMMSVKITQEMLDDEKQGPKLKALGLLAGDHIEIPVKENDTEPTTEDLKKIEEEQAAADDNAASEEEEVVEEKVTTPPVENTEEAPAVENIVEEESVPTETVENTATEENSIVALLNSSALKLNTALSQHIEENAPEEVKEEVKEEVAEENKFELNLESFKTICESLEENGLVEVKLLLEKLVKTAENSAEEVGRLTNVLDSIPKYRALRVSTQHGGDNLPDKQVVKKEGAAIRSAFAARGLSNLLRK